MYLYINIYICIHILIYVYIYIWYVFLYRSSWIHTTILDPSNSGNFVAAAHSGFTISFGTGGCYWCRDCKWEGFSAGCTSGLRDG